MSKTLIKALAKSILALSCNAVFVWLMLSLSIWGFRQPWSMATPTAGSFYIMSALVGGITAIFSAVTFTVFAMAWGFDDND